MGIILKNWTDDYAAHCITPSPSSPGDAGEPPSIMCQIGFIAPCTYFPA